MNPPPGGFVFSDLWNHWSVNNLLQVNYSLLGDICHLWRNYYDVQDSWDSVQGIFDWFFDHQDDLQPAAGPGRWNDPDMV